MIDRLESWILKMLLLLEKKEGDIVNWLRSLFMYISDISNSPIQTLPDTNIRKTSENTEKKFPSEIVLTRMLSTNGSQFHFYLAPETS